MHYRNGDDDCFLALSRSHTNFREDCKLDRDGISQVARLYQTRHLHYPLFCKKSLSEDKTHLLQNKSAADIKFLPRFL